MYTCSCRGRTNTTDSSSFVGSGLGLFRTPCIGQVHHRYSVWPANRSVNQTDMRNRYLKFVDFFFVFLPQYRWCCFISVRCHLPPILSYRFRLANRVRTLPPTPFSNFPHGTILLQSHGQATFLVPKTVVISHPTVSLLNFTSNYFTLQKMLYSRAF
jgi:hypothetical protein